MQCNKGMVNLKHNNAAKTVSSMLLATSQIHNARNNYANVRLISLQTPGHCSELVTFSQAP